MMLRILSKITVFTWMVMLLISGTIVQPTQALQTEGDLVPIRANDLFAARPTRQIWRNVDPDGTSIEYLRGATENVTFEQLCAGEFALLSTSVTPTADQLEACGHPIIEMMVALDGAVLIASEGVDFTTCLTTEEVQAVWGTNGETRWNAVNPDYPDRSVSAYISNNNTDTLAFFESVILGDAGLRTDTFPLGTDHDRRIRDRQSAVGFVPLARYLPDAEAFSALSFDNGNGCIAPTDENFADRSYASSAPVYWYVLADSPWLENEALINMIHFALGDDGHNSVVASGSTPPPNDYSILSITNFDNRITGPSISDPSSTSSDMVIRLTWQTNHDLDLGVQLPNGNYVSFMNPSQAGIYRIASSGNEHCSEVTTPATEEIIFAENAAEVATYFAFVQQSFKCNATEDAATFTLEFIIDGEVVKSIQGSVEGENNVVESYTFTASDGE